MQSCIRVFIVSSNKNKAIKKHKENNAGLILNHMRGTPETWAKLGTMAYPMKAVMEDLDHLHQEYLP